MPETKMAESATVALNMTEPPVERRSAKKIASHVFLHFGMVWVLILVIIGAQVIYPGFLDPGNLSQILSQNAPLGIIAVGMTMVMIAGGFDLSVGAIYAATAVLYADMANKLPLPAAVLIALILGLAMGLVNGLLVTKLKVNAFVATLGTSSVFGGGAYIYSQSTPIVVNKEGFEELGLGSFLGVPNATWLFIVVFILGAFILSRTVYGKSLYAIGGNQEAARLAGIRVDRLRIITYTVVGICSAIGGLIIASRVGVGQADLGGTIALDSIAVVVIGGTSLFGGEGAMWRTGIGLLIIACITNVSDSIGLDTNSQAVMKGAIIVFAVALDAYSRRRNG
ncbi:ABC transporter permease [Schumannella luteola]|uniref:Autoinducer 2 import system permease protein LsrD n=1 Tax=Schumannella luteola TaxID=472059 RepID=A0A852YCL8_9MICO|nr:ribose transport system permease protein [Schumannella luteola]